MSAFEERLAAHNAKLTAASLALEAKLREIEDWETFKSTFAASAKELAQETGMAALEAGKVLAPIALKILAGSLMARVQK